MKSTGMVRPLDNLGRVVLPIELRRSLQLEPKDPVEIFVDGEAVILKKYEPGCAFCGGMDGLVVCEGRNVCRACAAKIAERSRG